MTEKTGRFQQKLEEKQAASLQSIKERESQVRTTFLGRTSPNPQRINLYCHPLPGDERVDEGPTQTPEGSTAHPRAPVCGNDLILHLQLQQQVRVEYEEKLRALNMEVQEMVKNYTKASFPAEPQTGKEAGWSIPEGEQGSTDQLEANIPVAEVSRLTLAMTEPSGAGMDVEIEESIF